VLDALSRLSLQPDLLMFDGQGIAHPRRFGIASHIGLLLDKPSIGCAKTRLIGRYREPDPEKGSYAYLKDQDETIGAVLRTRDGVKPVYVSVGHRVDLLDSIRIVLQCCGRYRLPEPIRRAHQLAREKARS
jgi:deoxyribonuclease V